MPLVPRTIPMRLVATGIALLLVASLGTAAWFALPRWCPRMVIRYSPWLEPVLRAYGFSGDSGYTDYEFVERFTKRGQGDLPYLHRVLFTHPDAAMRHASQDALNGLAGWSDTMSFSDPTVLVATFAALADDRRFPEIESVGGLEMWLTTDDGVGALRSVYHSLDSEHRIVLLERLPDPSIQCWFTQYPNLVRCYIEFLADPEPLIRERAALVLRTMSLEGAFPDCFAIVQTLQPRPPDTHASALDDLVRSLAEPSDLSGIISWLGKSSGQPVAQMHLAYACAILRNSATVPALTATLTAADPGARIHALQALRDIGDAHALDAVISLLKDPDESVRCMAVWTIGRLRDPRVPELLKRALEDPDPLVARAAERSSSEFLAPASPAP